MNIFNFVRKKLIFKTDDRFFFFEKKALISQEVCAFKKYSSNYF